MSSKQTHSPAAILLAVFFFILWWFKIYFTSDNIAAVDLPSHFVLARGLRDNLFDGRLTFYDHTTFTGFPVFRFYGFLPALVAVVLSIPLELFSPDPIALATHLILVFGMAAFPLSFYFAARPMAVEVLGGEQRFSESSWLVALLSATFAFWFLNHDHQWYGIGAAAPMNIGLFAQVFGWHIFLLYLGLLLRLREGKSFRKLALCYALLPLCHTLTFVFASIVGGGFFLFFKSERRAIFFSHVLGFGLAGFWFIPTLKLLGDYTAFDIYRPKGDFLEILFRYPWYGLFRSVKSWVAGEYSQLDPIHILQPLLILILFLHPRIPKNGITFTLTLFSMLCVVVFSSGFTASSLPIGLHYYRFIAYEFLLFNVLTSVAPLVLVGVGKSRNANISRDLLAICALGSLIIIIRLPHYERDRISNHVGLKYLKDERKIVEYFKGIESKGRVYVEYLTDYDKFPFLSAHYLSSRLFVETGFEAVVNSHVQESLAYRMLVASARLLGAKTYNVPLLFTDEADLPRHVLYQQLKDFGVTHVVCGRKEFCEKLEREVSTPPKEIGLYKIYEIRANGLEKINSVNKELIGYLDLKGNLPFYLVQYFFYSKQNYYKRFHLIDLDAAEPIPSQLSLVIVNTEKEDSRYRELSERARDVKIGAIDFEKHYLLNHYEPHYPHNMELDRYKDAEKYLRNFLPFDLLFREREQKASEQDSAALAWGKGGQSFTIEGARPGGVYRVNYAYFPYWKAQGAKLFRGSEERMYLIAATEKISAFYSPWSARASWVGLTLSILSMLALFAKRSK